MSDPAPKYPYVKFRAIINSSTKNPDTGGVDREERPEEYYLNISGVHGRPVSIQEFQRMGHKLVDYGNLTHEHKQNLQPYLDQQLNRNIDPRLLVDIEPMTTKIKAAREK